MFTLPLDTKSLSRLRFLTIGLLVVILWAWELLEHFLILSTQTALFIEILPLTLLLVVLLYFLFRTIIKAYQRLQESNRQLSALQNYQASILDSSPNAIITVDEASLIRNFNQQAESISGYTAKDAIGTNIVGFFKDEIGIRKHLERAHSHGSLETIKETALITKQGAPIPVSVLLKRIKERDENGNGVVLIVEDLREKKRLERRLIVSEKMAAVSQLAAGLAHEIKNPLTSMGVNLRNLEDQFKKQHTATRNHEEYFAMISSEIARLNHLVDHFVRSVVPNKIELSTRLCRLDEIVDLAMERCERLLKDKSIQVAKNLQAPPVCVECDREQLSQAFTNLIQNAVEAMQLFGKLTLEVRQEGDWGQVKVCDTGCGIPRENLEQVFDFNFSTKPGGMGVGLPFASWVIEHHGGRIEIASEGDKGTDVLVWLPAKRSYSDGQ